MDAHDKPRLLVWDILTGAVISDIRNPRTVQIQFSGNRRMVYLPGNYFGGCSFCTNGRVWSLDDERVIQWPDHRLGAHWSYEGNIRFATSSLTGGKWVVKVHELHQASDSPLLVESFPIPCAYWNFAFSPISFHASFTNEAGILVIDVRTSELLLRTEVTGRNPSPLGLFSPNGRFFVYEASEYEIRVWQNSPTNYVPCGSFRSRFQFEGFSFSPTSPSMLTWGRAGIQLLHPDTLPAPTSSSPPNNRRECHLVARFADCARIATVRKWDHIITVLDCPLGALQRSIDTGMKFQDIKIVDGIIIVANDTLARWDPETGRRVHGARSVVPSHGTIAHLTLSQDCSQVAVLETSLQMIFVEIRLLGVEPPKAIASLGRPHSYAVAEIRFSPDQRELWLLKYSHHTGVPRGPFSVTKLGAPGSGGGEWKMVTEMLDSEDDTSAQWSWIDLFSRGYRIGSGAKWIKDPRGAKILWLPPNWRSVDGLDVRWDGNFLALLDSHHPVPIIIEFPS